MSRRIIAIIIAIVLAGLGAAGGLFLIITADERARDRLTEPVTVAVSVVAIPAGTTGERVRTQNMVRFEQIPKSLAPKGVLTEITADLDTKVATRAIAAGQIVLASNFDDRSRVTSGLTLPKGKMAVTVATGAPEQVAGYVQSGSQVTIFLTYKIVNKKGQRSGVERTRVLLPRVEVLAIGTYKPTQAPGSTSTATTTARGTLMVTVAVDQDEAERLIEAVSHGTLYLGLLTDSVEVQPGEGVDNTDIGDPAAPLFK